MKKNDPLKTPLLLPKKTTLQFLLQFSKSLATLKSTRKVFAVCKN